MRNFLFKKQPKNIILLDIDGVLNLFRLEKPEDNLILVKNSWLTTWRIREEIADWLITLSKRKDVKIVWLSTWQEESNLINKKLKIPEFEWTDKYFLPKNVSSTIIKRKQIDFFIEEFPNSRIISIDDDLASSNSHLHIQPDPREGLTNIEINTLNLFLNKE